MRFWQKLNRLGDDILQANTSIIFQETTQPIKTFDVTEALFSKRSFITNKIEEIKSRTLAENVTAQLPDYIRAFYHRSKLPSGMTEEMYITNKIRKSIAASPVRDADVINILTKAPFSV